MTCLLVEIKEFLLIIRLSVIPLRIEIHTIVINEQRATKRLLYYKTERKTSEAA